MGCCGGEDEVSSKSDILVPWFSFFSTLFGILSQRVQNDLLACPRALSNCKSNILRDIFELGTRCCLDTKQSPISQCLLCFVSQKADRRPPKSRSPLKKNVCCTDIIFLIIFVLFWAGMVRHSDYYARALQHQKCPDQRRLCGYG